MTLEELQAYVGCPRTHSTYYLEHRGALDITAWEDTMAGERGWWYAVTRPSGDHEIVVAIGWTAGRERDRDREIEIACKLAPREPLSEELSS